jgi:predicted nuclease with TOPRIM domain
LSELKALREDMSSVKGDVSGLKEDMSGVKGDVSGLKEDMSGVKGDVSGLKEKVDEMDKKLNAVYEQTAFLTEFKEEISKNNKRIEQENRRLKEIVGRHELEIQDLKQKIG